MYHDLITEKSWKVLQEFKRKFRFILIGGWAVYLYTQALKSKDIDLICQYEELQKLKEQYELIKNDRLKKYEIHIGEFDIDIYTPFFSELGIPAEDLETMTRVVEGFTVLEPEALLILKQKAYEERKHSHKGEKDKIDIIALLRDAADFQKYKILIKHYKLSSYEKNLRHILEETQEAPELGLNKHAFAKLKSRLLQ